MKIEYTCDKCDKTTLLTFDTILEYGENEFKGECEFCKKPYWIVLDYFTRKEEYEDYEEARTLGRFEPREARLRAKKLN